MKKIIFLAAASIVCSGLLFTSCKKKETEDNDTEAASDHAMGETASNDISNIGNQASFSNMTTYKLGASDQIYTMCATITRDTLNNTNPDTLTVDFGTGCTGLDNRTRKGILQFVYTAGLHYRDSGNVITVTTPNNTYYVDNNQIIINSKTITNKGHVTNGMLTWVIASDIKINRANGNVVTWNTTNRTKVLLAGETAPNKINWPQAKVAIFGDATGSHTKLGGSTHTFSARVLQSKWLVRDFTCGLFKRFFVSGTLEFTPDSKPTRYVNFGTGNCDDQAVVTINGHAYNITLH